MIRLSGIIIPFLKANARHAPQQWRSSCNSQAGFRQHRNEKRMTTRSIRSASAFVFPTLLMGAVAGLRSQLPGALLALAVRQGALPRGQRAPLRWLGKRWSLPLAALAAVGELLGDKLPWTPSRLAPVPLLGRLAGGSAAGAAIADAAGRPALAGAALGAAGAGIGSIVGYYARTSLSAATGIASPIAGVAEDLVSIGLGQLAIGQLATKDGRPQD
jgi:uncharacterized membrane protein